MSGPRAEGPLPGEPLAQRNVDPGLPADLYHNRGPGERAEVRHHPATTRHGWPRCMVTADGMTCERPATPAHDIHDDRDHGLWITHPGPGEPDGDRPYTGYRLLVAETHAQEEARYRFWFGGDTIRPNPMHSMRNPAAPRGYNEHGRPL